MSERWVLVPVEPTEEMSSHQMPGSWELSLAVRPPVSREWLEAATERALNKFFKALRGDRPWREVSEPEFHETHVKVFRAAILAALELEDTP